MKSPEEAQKLYDSWAGTYDKDLTGAYVAPKEIASLLQSEVASRKHISGWTPEPILDVAVGTGLIGEHLTDWISRQMTPFPTKAIHKGDDTDWIIDGLDISSKMLEKARAKKRYRQLIQGDLNKPLELSTATYGAIVSCGFLGGYINVSVCLNELLRVAKPGALFVMSLDMTFFDACKYGSTLAELAAAGFIGPIRFTKVRALVFEDDKKEDEICVIFERTSKPIETTERAADNL